MLHATGIIRSLSLCPCACVCVCVVCVCALLPAFIFYFYTFKILSDKTKAFEKRKERQAERRSRKVMGRKHRMAERDGDINSGDGGNSQWRLRLVLEGATEQMAAPQRERDHGRDIITLGLNSERHKERKKLKKSQKSAHAPHPHSHAFVRWVAKGKALLSIIS